MPAPRDHGTQITAEQLKRRKEMLSAELKLHELLCDLEARLKLSIAEVQYLLISQMRVFNTSALELEKEKEVPRKKADPGKKSNKQEKTAGCGCSRLNPGGNPLF